MPQTPDRRPGPLIESEEIVLGGDVTEPPALTGAMRYVSGDFKFKDSLGVFNPRDGGAMPPASQVGQVLFSVDGATFEKALPVTGPCGWLLADDGILIVNG